MNSEKEHLIGIATRRVLEIDIRHLEPKVLGRLKEARFVALDRQRQTVSGLVLAGNFGGLGVESLVSQVRTASAIAALILGMIGTYYWNTYEDADENAAIDSALLADDLPVDAYSDQGFHAWLNASSQSSP